MASSIEVSISNAKRLLKIGFGQLPYPELYPNALRRLHWRQRAEISKQARQEAYYVASGDIRQYLRGRPIKRAEVEIQFISKIYRTRDIDGLLSACKAWLDGLVDAGVLVNDDGWHIVKLTGTLTKGEEDNTIITVREA
ncbi:hypothetical protein CMI37_13810 [Candidatus Pacearchaeota archaeon]|nr:hypothetical protein [Candidatus Pacearchaeota archaeon]